MQINQFHSLWKKLKRWPAGDKLFQLFLTRAVPYSATVYPNIIEWDDGKCRIQVKDKKAIRNHLNSIHAIALANIGEMATGLALMSVIPDNVRFILTELNINYHKKARGTIEVYCELPYINFDNEQTLVLKSEARDKNGQLVSQAQATWLIGSKK